MDQEHHNLFKKPVRPIAHCVPQAINCAAGVVLFPTDKALLDTLKTFSTSRPKANEQIDKCYEQNLTIPLPLFRPLLLITEYGVNVPVQLIPYDALNSNQI